MGRVNVYLDGHVRGGGESEGGGGGDGPGDVAWCVDPPLCDVQQVGHHQPHLHAGTDEGAVSSLR